MKYPAITYCLFLAAAILSISCAEEECTNLDDPQLVLEFKTKFLTATGLPGERDTSLTIRNLYGLGKTEPKDTNFQAKSLILPLSQVSDETAYVLDYGSSDTTVNGEVQQRARRVTLAVSYRRQSFFVSDVCGFNVKFRELTLDTLRTTYPKDSIAIVKNLVDEANTANIRIYIRGK
jgi:hypothetical protein